MQKELFWHDGNIRSFAIDSEAKKATIELLLYKDLEARSRDKVLLTVAGLASVILAVPNFLELAKNRSAGEIADGRVSRLDGVEILRINLSAGYLEVSGRKIGFRRVTGRKDS